MFCTSNELLYALIGRINATSLEIDPVNREQIVLRVVGVLKYWIGEYPKEFKVDSALRELVMQFIENDIAPLNSEATNYLSSMLPPPPAQVEFPTRSRKLQYSPAIAIDDYSILAPNRICFVGKGCHLIIYFTYTYSKYCRIK